MRQIFAYLISVFLGLVITPGLCFGISTEELKGLMGSNEEITLIDIRANAAYKKAHIPEAINIPARLCAIKQLPPVGRVIVYGDGLDESTTLDALNALNGKSGIQAEMLEGGFSRWEALNYPSTRKKGFEEDNPCYISYQKLEAIVRSNPDLVLLDLRKRKKKQVLQGEPHGNLQGGAAQGRAFTDLSREFSGVRVISQSLDTGRGDKRMGLARAGGLKVQDSNHLELYVLIDNGDGTAEEMARHLKAAGIKRFVILAGGEESLVRKGQPGLKKKVTGIGHE